MIFFRFWVLTFGRLPWCNHLFKKLLVFLIIKRSKKKYVAASAYFDVHHLN